MMVLITIHSSKQRWQIVKPSIDQAIACVDRWSWEIWGRPALWSISRDRGCQHGMVDVNGQPTAYIRITPVRDVALDRIHRRLIVSKVFAIGQDIWRVQDRGRYREVR